MDSGSEIDLEEERRPILVPTRGGSTRRRPKGLAKDRSELNRLAGLQAIGQRVALIDFGCHRE
jgi:hypothetical protein